MRYIITIIILLCRFSIVHAWGFWAHRHINRCAVFTLPAPMFGFYKHYIGYLTDQAVNPDKRRYVVAGEAEKHYIDVDHYAHKLRDLPIRWSEAVERHTEATLTLHGILPWHIQRMKHALTMAFREQSLEQILRLSADIGHYIADANVPLHTAKNYNGQLTGQEGIHGLWEARLPELFNNGYELWIGQASYLADPSQIIWQAIEGAHNEVDNLLLIEQGLANSFPTASKFAFEIRGNALIKTYSRDYAQAYHTLLAGQVERQMQASIKMVGDFWFTCWVDGGQPNLDRLLVNSPTAEQLAEIIPDSVALVVRDCP